MSEPVEQLVTVRPQSAERREIVGTLQHVHGVDLQQSDVAEHTAHVPAVGLSCRSRPGQALGGDRDAARL